MASFEITPRSALARRRKAYQEGDEEALRARPKGQPKDDSDDKASY